MSLNRLCKACGKSFLIGEGSHKVKRPTCSDLCEKAIMAKVKKCKPICLEKHLSVREVFYKDGTNHLQQVCEKCLKVKYLPKRWGIQAGVINDQPDDLLTDAARNFQ